MKASDHLGSTMPQSTTAASAKQNLLQMQQIQHKIGVPQPKAHSHGISTPTAITNINVINPSPNTGSVMNVPKHLISAPSGKQQYMRETPLANTTGNTALRPSEVPGYSQEPKTSVTNTKRNSIASSLIQNEKSIRGSATKKRESRLRNQE